MTPPLERPQLRQLIADTIGVRDLDDDANLFVLGVDSVGILRLIQALGQRGYVIDAVEVYERPTVAYILDRLWWTGVSTPAASTILTTVWLSNIRHRLTQSFPDPEQPTRYEALDRTIPKVGLYRGSAPIALLERNVEALSRAYPQLRWRFTEREQAEVTASGDAPTLDRYRVESEEAAVRAASTFASTHFDLRGGRLIRFGSWEFTGGFVLAMGVDHIIADGHSRDVLWRGWLHGPAPSTSDNEVALARVVLPPTPPGARRDPVELAMELSPLEGTSADRTGPGLVRQLTFVGDDASAIIDLWRTHSLPHEAVFIAAYARAYADLTGVTEVPVTRNYGFRTGGVDDDPRVGWFSGWDVISVPTIGSGPSDLAEVVRQLLAVNARGTGSDAIESYTPFFSRYPDLGGRHPRAEFLFRREAAADPVPPGAEAAPRVWVADGEPESILGSELFVTQTEHGFTCDLLMRADRYPPAQVEQFLNRVRHHVTALSRLTPPATAKSL